MPRDREVLRLPKPPPDFRADRALPLGDMFLPSSPERKKTPVRISVWDATLTTVEQARAFRQVQTLACCASVEKLLARNLVTAVVYEPLAPPDDSKPGAEGACGIEGVERRRDRESPKDWRNRLDQIAEQFYWVR